MSNKTALSNYGGHWRYAFFAAPLAAIGIPIYIHAPKYLLDTYGFSLTALGIIFLGLRLIDVIQDPFLGKLAQLIGKYRQLSIVFFIFLLISSLWFFFAVEPFFNTFAYVCLTLFFMFTAFSYISICFYAQGIKFVEAQSDRSHSHLSAWRETGALIGIITACLLPSALEYLNVDPMRGFAFVVILLLIIAYFVMKGSWNYGTKDPVKDYTIFLLLKDKTTRGFLILSFLNASPVAVTSTLFLFFVEARLRMPELAGLFLITFFVGAAISVPFWGKLTSKYELKFVLSIGMTLAILTFMFTCLIGPGNFPAFFIICIISGACLGADMSILPAMFARHVAKTKFDNSVAFGVWNFFNKSTLAISAGLILPALAATGFHSGTNHSNTQLLSLTILYCFVPCILKIIALLTLNFGPIERNKN